MNCVVYKHCNNTTEQSLPVFYIFVDTATPIALFYVSNSIRVRILLFNCTSNLSHVHVAKPVYTCSKSQQLQS